MESTGLDLESTGLDLTIMASAAAMGAASTAGRVAVQSGHMAATAAVSMWTAMATLNARSAFTSMTEMTTTAAAAGTGAAAATVLAAGSLGMAATGAAAAITYVAFSSTYTLGSAMAGIIGGGQPGREPSECTSHVGTSRPPFGEGAQQAAKSRFLGKAARAPRQPSAEVGCFSCIPFLRHSPSKADLPETQKQQSEQQPRPKLPVQPTKPGSPTRAILQAPCSGSAVARQAEASIEQSRRRLQDHALRAPWHPTVLLYDASPGPPPKSSAERKQRTAYHMPLNSRRACPIDNEHFTGSFLFLHRLPADGSSVHKADAPYEWHFANKTRRWEARVQGRFRRKPTGALWTGCVLEDFDYSTEQSWLASALAATVVPLMEAVVGERFYFSWGTRGKAADQEDAELATIVTNLAGTDQVIHTPSSEHVPGIDSDISHLGLRRNAMSASAYRAAVKKVVDGISTEDTYTFCVWGCSRCIDVMNSSFTTSAFGSISYGGFIDEWPAHFVLYSLDEDEQDSRHLERKKMYFVDVMVWSSDMDLPKLPQRYCFKDERLPPEARQAKRKAQLKPPMPARSKVT